MSYLDKFETFKDKGTQKRIEELERLKNIRREKVKLSKEKLRLMM